MATEAPYPELKKTHTMPRKGRPWRDYKPPPSGPVWNVIQGFGIYWELVAAIDLGLFDALETLGPSTFPDVAGHLAAAPIPTRHLLDAMVTLGFLDQVADTYELTETAERYLTTDGAASMASLVRVAPGPHANWTRLADTIRTGAVAEPIELDPAAFYGPLVEATFPTQLRCSTRLGLRLGWARRSGLRVLDLGAGCAPWAIGILQASVGSTAVVNDLPGVAALATARLSSHGLAERAEVRTGDFHEIEIEESAYDIVVLGHILRTEGEERSRSLIERSVRALRPGGEVIVADYFADNDRKYNPFGVQMGLTMLANTMRGGLLTHAQVSGWLAAAGCRPVRLLEPIAFNQVYVAGGPR
jgi:SAM-dependent methyltransferase